MYSKIWGGPIFFWEGNLCEDREAPRNEVKMWNESHQRIRRHQILRASRMCQSKRLAKRPGSTDASAKEAIGMLGELQGKIEKSLFGHCEF